MTKKSWRMKKKASEKGTFEDGPFLKKNGREVNADHMPLYSIITLLYEKKQITIIEKSINL